jgi:hypothetical protein
VSSIIKFRSASASTSIPASVFNHSLTVIVTIRRGEPDSPPKLSSFTHPELSDDINHNRFGQTAVQPRI